MFEVEIKLKLSTEEEIILASYLKTSTQFEGKFSQTDFYFDTSDPSYETLDKALRVRFQHDLGQVTKRKTTVELTFKGPKIRPNSKSRKEINLILKENTNFESIKLFLNELGFVHKFTIEKEREQYSLKLDEYQVHFSLDKNIIGTFLELETIIENQNKDKIIIAEQRLWDLLKEILPMSKLQPDRKITKSYLELILESRESKED